MVRRKEWINETFKLTQLEFLKDKLIIIDSFEWENAITWAQKLISNLIINWY